MRGEVSVGSGDRSERIRTYNFPQGRITDHRINLTIYKLNEVIEGQLQQVIQPLINEYQADLLSELEESRKFQLNLIYIMMSHLRLDRYISDSANLISENINSDSSRLDAELLIARSFGKNRSFLYSYPRVYALRQNIRLS